MVTMRPKLRDADRGNSYRSFGGQSTPTGISGFRGLNLFVTIAGLLRSQRSGFLSWSLALQRYRNGTAVAEFYEECSGRDSCHFAGAV